MRRWLHDSFVDHDAYEAELGFPTWLARLEDTLFEGMPNHAAKSFPVTFLEAVPVGRNLEAVKWRFIGYILDELLSHGQPAKDRRVYQNANRDS